MSNGPMEVISPFVLRAIACDMEEMQSPQAWADRCRAAAAEIEKLRAALKQTARYVDNLASERYALQAENERLRGALGEKA